MYSVIFAVRKINSYYWNGKCMHSRCISTYWCLYVCMFILTYCIVCTLFAGLFTWLISIFVLIFMLLSLSAFVRFFIKETALSHPTNNLLTSRLKVADAFLNPKGMYCQRCWTCECSTLNLVPCYNQNELKALQCHWFELLCVCVCADATCGRRWRWLTLRILTVWLHVHSCFLVTSFCHLAIVRYVTRCVTLCCCVVVVMVVAVVVGVGVGAAGTSPCSTFIPILHQWATESDTWWSISAHVCKMMFRCLHNIQTMLRLRLYCRMA